MNMSIDDAEQELVEIARNKGEEVRYRTLSALARRLDDIRNEVADRSGLTVEQTSPTIAATMIEFAVHGLFELMTEWDAEEIGGFSEVVARGLATLAMGKATKFEIEIKS